MRKNKTRPEAAEALRRVVSTVGRRGEPGEHIRCVVSVAMLTEGWDANNVTHILGLRAFTSQLLCEQVVGRGLRRMDYTPDPETGLLTEEYVDVYGIPFSVVPFKGRAVDAPAPEDRPKNHVFAMPERVLRNPQFEIRFPVVDGYAFALKRNLLACDVAYDGGAGFGTEPGTNCDVPGTNGRLPRGEPITECDLRIFTAGSQQLLPGHAYSDHQVSGRKTVGEPICRTGGQRGRGVPTCNGVAIAPSTISADLPLC